MKRAKAQRIQNNEFVENGLEIKLQWAGQQLQYVKRCLTVWINSFVQRKSSSAKSKKGNSYIFLLGLYTITVFKCTVIFLLILSPPCNGIFLLCIPLLHSISTPPCVDQVAGFDTCFISTFLKFLWIAIRLNVAVQISPPH